MRWKWIAGLVGSLIVVLIGVLYVIVVTYDFNSSALSKLSWRGEVPSPRNPGSAEERSRSLDSLGETPCV